VKYDHCSKRYMRLLRLQGCGETHPSNSRDDVVNETESLPWCCVPHTSTALRLDHLYSV